MFRAIAILGLLAAVLWVVATVLRPQRKAPPAKPTGWQRLAYMALLLGVGLAAGTGLGNSIVSSEAIGGWTLMIHCAAAGFFAVAIVAVGALWAGRYGPEAPESGALLFWLMMALSVVVILSAVAPMTSFFASATQKDFYELHRYSSLALVVVVVLHAARVVRAR
jgi:hypothetical protein